MVIFVGLKRTKAVVNREKTVKIHNLMKE